MHIRQTARQLHRRAHQLLRHGLERHDFASVAHHAAVFADVHQLVRDLAELLVQVVILPSGCRCEAYAYLFQRAHQREKALGQLLTAGQQRAVHIDCNEFDGHGIPGLNESALMLTRFRSKNTVRKGIGYEEGIPLLRAKNLPSPRPSPHRGEGEKAVPYIPSPLWGEG